MADNTRIASRRGVVPVGSIIPFYEFATDVLTYDSATWKICNGQTVTVSGVGVVTLPDLSERYLVGYGTEYALGVSDFNGNGDIDDPFSNNLVGVAGSVYDLTHSHTHNHYHDLASHTHSLQSHVHLETDHAHWMSTLSGGTRYRHYHQYHNTGSYHDHRFFFSSGGLNYTYDVDGVGSLLMYNGPGPSVNTIGNSDGTQTCDYGTFWTRPALTANGDVFYTSQAGVVSPVGTEWYTGWIYTQYTGTPNTGTPSLTTTYDTQKAGGQVNTTSLSNTAYQLSPPLDTYNMSSGLSSTDIKPRSVRVRFIMRVA